MRYFIEVAYMGARYGGFQVQENSNTIQAEIEKALFTFFRQPFSLTGSSRTDAGVHARQNYFHADTSLEITERQVYNLNSILPDDIAIKRIFQVPAAAHCRFDAVQRTYQYYIYAGKDPFLNQRAWYYPYPLNLEILQEAATLLAGYEDFTSFSKRNTQAKTKTCFINESRWLLEGEQLIYRVTANRFLRGMVKGLVGTMLQLGREKIGITELKNIVDARDCNKAFFDTPAHGLYLMEVAFKNIS